MAQYALFLKPDDSLLLSFVESNYDQDQLRALIYEIQVLYIEPLIGSGLYDELTTQIIANTVTSANTSLLNEIRPVVRNYVLSKGIIVFTYKIRNKGVVSMSSENSQPADFAALDRLIQQFTDWAQVRADRLQKFLCANVTTYPLYANAGSTEDTIHPRKNEYQTGWNMSLDTDRTYLSLDSPDVQP
jgi:hypothetical protein